MAGHWRTEPAPGVRRTGPGRMRRNRAHLPDGDADKNRRERDVAGGKSRAHTRIRETTDELERVLAAVAYLRKADKHYRPASGQFDHLTRQLIATADQLIRHGERRTAAEKDRRKGGSRAA